MDELQGGQLSPPAAQPSAKPPSYAARSAESDPWAPQAEQPRPAQPQPQPRPQPVVDLLGGDSNDPFGAPAPPSAPQPQPAPAVDIMAALASSAAPTAAAPAGDRYKALTDYAPGDPRMLALKKGDLLTKEREEDGWFFGANDRGQSGYFPFAPRQQPRARVRARARVLAAAHPPCVLLARLPPPLLTLAQAQLLQKGGVT